MMEALGWRAAIWSNVRGTSFVVVTLKRSSWKSSCIGVRQADAPLKRGAHLVSSRACRPISLLRHPQTRTRSLDVARDDTMSARGCNDENMLAVFLRKEFQLRRMSLGLGAICMLTS